MILDQRGAMMQRLTNKRDPPTAQWDRRSLWEQYRNPTRRSMNLPLNHTDPLIYGVANCSQRTGLG